MRVRQRARGVAASVTAVAVLAGSGCSSSEETTTGDDGDSGLAPVTAAEAEEAATEFLTAWAAGDTEGAAELSDDPEAADEALAGYAADTGLAELELEPGSVTGGPAADVAVPFSVRATLEHDGETADWEYESELTVVRTEDGAEDDAEGAAESAPVAVVWAPEVLHPELGEGRELEVRGIEEAPPVQALDRHGEPLDAAEFASLEPLLTDLALAQGEAAGGSAGAALHITGDDAPDEALVELAEPRSGEIPTTLDPEIQRAAESAVADTHEASLVAVEPSTGAVRAVANSVPESGERAHGNDQSDPANRALRGISAPGSTWKIVTSGLMLEEGLADPDEDHPCPQFLDHGGWEFQNLDEFEIEDGTFTDSFAASCNTAFVDAASELDDDQLAGYAGSAFGIGLDWDAGVPVASGVVPEESGAQMAAQLIGQAGIRTNPLVMASVSATVRSGEFRQPHLVPPEFGDRQPAEADGPSAEAAEQLRGLMAATAAHGTAAEAMAGLSGDVGAKTGSAEVPDQDDPNAWFTGYREDLAAAAIVTDAGHGGKHAGPLVAEVLAVAGE